ncbi:MAG: DUF2341 domain-containing protein [Pseudomonadota bacterium]
MTKTIAQRFHLPGWIVLLSFLIPSAHAWWAPDWTQRKTIAVNSTATGVNLQSAVTEAPTLVRLHSGNFPQFLNVRDGGIDFRFIAGDDQTPLKYHVEKFDAASGIALVWVKVPAINPQSTDNEFKLYFSNNTAVNGADAGGTYDVDTALVLHFNESAGVVDSTAYQTPVSGAPITNPASIIGNGVILSGAEPITISDAGNLNFSAEKGFTIGMWVRFDELPETPVYLLDRADPAGARLSVLVNAGQVVANYSDAQVSGPNITPGQWHYIAFVAGTTEAVLYVDGAPVGNAPITPMAMTGATYIGGGSDGTGLAAVQLDELQISTVARSADFIALSAAIQGPRNDQVVTYGGDETSDQAAHGEEGGGHASHFGIIIQNVFGRSEAIVEQIVIGICILMAAVAVMVMFVKAMNLSSARRATNKFLRAFNGLAEQGQPMDALLESGKGYRDSPLYRVYEQGFKEVNLRVSPSVGAASAGLDSKAMGAISAAMDTQMVREGQKLNSLLVLLTIAISGGPFVGLLGTVVGVMVTFAAIAATGDVNIAAIAPGMAAALLATVAGLGVAIPALFGYNYLSSKVKEISADMHVFADEFAAKINEQYGA